MLLFVSDLAGLARLEGPGWPAAQICWHSQLGAALRSGLEAGNDNTEPLSHSATEAPLEDGGSEVTRPPLRTPEQSFTSSISWRLTARAEEVKMATLLQITFGWRNRLILLHTDTEYHSENEKYPSTIALSMSTSIHILIWWVDVEEIDRISTRQISKTLKEKNNIKTTRSSRVCWKSLTSSPESSDFRSISWIETMLKYWEFY